MRKQEERRAKQEEERNFWQSQQLWESQRANELAAERAEKERLDALYKPAELPAASEVPFTPEWYEKHHQEETLDDIKSELQRANDLAAERAQQERLDRINEDFQRIQERTRRRR